MKILSMPEIEEENSVTTAREIKQDNRGGIEGEANRGNPQKKEQESYLIYEH